MHKEVKDVVKGLQIYANPPSSFCIQQKSHLKMSWEMFNDDGERVRVPCILPVSPSIWRWKENHQRNLKRTFRERNISTEITHIRGDG